MSLSYTLPICVYTSDMAGQIIRRDESLNAAPGAPAPHEVSYRYGGRQLGTTGNNGTLDTDYQSSIAARTQAAPGAFRGGAAAGSAYADFAQGYEAINSFSAGAGSEKLRTV